MENSLTEYYEPGSLLFTDLSKTELEQKLHDFIEELMEKDFRKLENLIYRHDVDERKFNIALQLPEIDQRVWRITHLVIDRELEKIESRNAYRKYKTDKNNKTITE